MRTYQKPSSRDKPDRQIGRLAGFSSTECFLIGRFREALGPTPPALAGWP